MWSALAKTETTTSTLKCFQGPRFNPQLWLQSVWSLKKFIQVSDVGLLWILWLTTHLVKTCQHASSWIGYITLALGGNVWDTLRLLKMSLPKQNVNSYVCPKPWPHPISALIRPSQRSDIAFLRTWKTLKNHTTKHVGVNELSNFQSVESAKGSQSALHCCLANFLKLMFFHRPPEIYPWHASNDISLKNLLGRVWALPKQSPALWNGLTCL